MSDGDQLFTFEIVNTNSDESFLLEDWTRSLQDPRAPYAFLLSSYKGDYKERLDQLIKYVDWLIQVTTDLEEFSREKVGLIVL